MEQPQTGPEPGTAVVAGNALQAARAALKPARKRRPLIGVEAVHDDKRVLIVSEAALEAARTLFGTRFTCLSWKGGIATSDWAPLYGRSVDLWPDASNAGDTAIAAIVEILLPRLAGGELRIMLQEERRDGWNLSNALADGWGIQRLADHVNRDGGKHIRLFRNDLQVGKPHDGIAPIEVEPEPGKPRDPPVWHQQMGLAVGSNGPYPTESNTVIILGIYPEFAGKIWLNDFSHKLMWDNEPFQRDTHAVRMLIEMQSKLAMHKLPLHAVERAAVVVGSANTRHPVREWLKLLKWDGIERLDGFMHAAFGCPSTPYTNAVGRCWLVSMVARVMEPGCQADCMVVLEGAQGVRKSTALRTLGGEWFVESHADPIHDRKEFLQGLQGRWLIEIPELHTIAGRNSIEKIKGMISNRVDAFRVPYGHDIADFPRQCVFAGSTNAETWNPDSTGGRRFWPIVCGTIDVDWIEQAREQLFAEAMWLYEKDHCWWDVPEEAARAEQEARRETDPWEAMIAEHVQYKDSVTVADIMDGLLQIKAGDWTQGQQNRVARSLRAIDWQRIQVRRNNVREWVYRPKKPIQPQLSQKETDQDF